MKRIYSIAFWAMAVTVVLCGCSDFLDQDNRSNVPSDEFYETKVGFESLINSTYSTLRDIYNSSSLLFIAGTDLYADGKTQGVVMSQYTFTADEGTVKDFYVDCYKGIQLANSVIAYGETTEESDVRLQYIDEARFIRAWYYFVLVQQFGPVALNTTMFDAAEMNHERSTLAEMYTFLMEEFTYLSSSSSHLPDRSASGVGRASKQAALFHLAKVYLTRGWLDGTGYEAQEATVAQATDFENASRVAEQLINNTLPSLSLEEAFDIHNEENDEFFWSIQYSSIAVNDPVKEGSRQQALFGAYLGGSEKPRNKATDGTIAPALRLHQMYARGDGRLEQTFMLEFHEDAYFDFYTSPTSTPVAFYYAPWWATDEDIAAWQANDPYGLKNEAIISKTVAEGGISPSNGTPASYRVRRSHDYGVPCIRKFDDYTESSVSNRDINCSMHDVVVARLGEVYLIAAEAYLKQNQPGEAARMINNLRKRPGTIKEGFEREMTVSAEDISIDFILDERAREMAGEYVRWTDLKRTHKLVEYATAYNEDGIAESAMKGPDGKYKILRPIPQASIDLNQAEVEQNPGY
ncbi:MAG: RagB/SusD family nutrient uptake outer membrane protein [Bacteroides sp.]|nr:RagB/SusD family nutrient uptake outer membrane protein [Bacteroides sp.]